MVDFFDTVGTLALGSRFKRLGEALLADGRIIYRNAGVDFEPRWFPLFFLLRERGQITVTDAASTLDVPHPYISQLIKEMRRAKIVAFRRNPSDGRSRLVTLSPGGKELVRQVEPIWEDIRYAIDTVVAKTDADVLGLLKKIEGIMAETPMSRIVEMKHNRRPAVARNGEQFPVAGIEIRPIQQRDNAAMANVIRTVMTEIGASGEGFAIHDPEVDDMHEAYRGEQSAYFVVIREGTVVGGGGIAPLRGGESTVCELQKLYFLPTVRGIGAGRAIVARCLAQARRLGYSHCYLETFGATTQAAQRLYEHEGFTRIPGPMGNTGHFSCDTFFVKALI